MATPTQDAREYPGERYGIVLPDPRSSMFQWAGRIGHPDTAFATGTTAWWPTMEQAAGAGLHRYGTKGRNWYVAHLTHSAQLAPAPGEVYGA